MTDLYLNLLADGRLMHRNSNITINGWETDAYLTSVTYTEGADQTNPDNMLSYFVAKGSYLNKNDKVFLSTLSKVFTHVVYENDKMQVQLDGQPLMHVNVRAAKKPSKLVLNGF